MKRICVITDNEFIYQEMKKIISSDKYKEYQFDFFFSITNKTFSTRYASDEDFNAISLKEKNEHFYKKYELFISLHCKQLFPPTLVNTCRCINVHPGYNPFNRGWYPQVFSILNKQDAGVTVHEMDAQLDHGPVIYQEKVEIEESDTSYDVYKKIQSLEIKILEQNLKNILEGNYVAVPMSSEGNINLKKDFDKLCELDLNEKATYGEVIDRLRALTFEGYDNAYFFDGQGQKIYISVRMRKG